MTAAGGAGGTGGAVAGPIYRFSSCELNAGTRELRVCGQLRSIEPRAFDVLLALLRQRGRTVSTHELLDRLWPGEEAAPGCVANAMAKVRRAIGDKGRPPLVLTIHRVGYRFVGDVVENMPARRARLEDPAAAARLPVALLPFENLTGSPAFDRLAPGLMSEAWRALAGDARLAPVPASTVASALQRIDGRADERACVRAVQALTGARHVVCARLRRDGVGHLLECRLLGPDREAQAALRASDPAALGRVLASWLLERLPLRGDAPAVAPPESDPWTLEVAARAAELSAARRWERAAALHAVVLDMMPGHAASRLGLLEARARRLEADGRFGAALDLWREAVACAQAAGPRAAALHANGRAALAAAMCGLLAEAAARAEDGLAQAQAAGPADDPWRHCAVPWQVQAMLGRSVRLPAARPAGADPGGRAHAAWSLGSALERASLDDHAGALPLFARAASSCRAAGAHGREGAVILWWLHSLLEAGRLGEAQAMLPRAQACSAGRGPLLRALPWMRARIIDAAGDRAAALATLAPVLAGAARDLAHAAAASLAAGWLAGNGRAADARAMLADIAPGFEAHRWVRAAEAAVQAPGA